MTRVILAVFGLGVGATLSSFLASGCGSCPAMHGMPVGTYAAAAMAEPDYKFVVGANNTIYETFTRNGKTYVINYNATP